MVPKLLLTMRIWGLENMGGGTNSTKTSDCQEPVNCSLSDWGACSEPCGSGTQTRTRTDAQHGGTDCTGDTSLSRLCNQELCPVNCVGQFGICGSGCTEKYNISQEAVGAGTPCSEVAGVERGCSGGQCPTPINCSMSAYGACSEPCGGGTQTRTKTPAQHDGVDCTGDTTLSRSCNEPACPVNCVGSFGTYWQSQYCNSDCKHTYSIGQEVEGSGTSCDYTAGYEEACTGGDHSYLLSLWPLCSKSS